MRLVKVKTSLSPVDSKETVLVENTMILGNNETIRTVLERIYPNDRFHIVSFSYTEIDATIGKEVYDLGHIDFPNLTEQKAILVNMIQDWGEADDEQQQMDAQKVEGILRLVDHIQDYAVDYLGLPQEKVFPNLEKDAEEVGDMISEAFDSVGDGEDDLLEDDLLDEINWFKLPEVVQVILNSYDDDKELYEECDRIIEELEQHGYTAEYGLDGQIHSLKKL